MRTRPLWVFNWAVLAVSGLVVSNTTWAQEETSQPTSEIQVEPHWSPYQAPTSYPEGTQLHIIVRGDTLWDLSNQYLANPFLWPQLWDANRYITDPHLIYPGDPLVIPELDVVRTAEGEPGEPGARPGEPRPGEPGAPGQPGAPGAPGGPAGPSLIPIYEEVAIQCAGFVTDSQDESMKIIGSEEGDAKLALATGDIVYLNKGSREGIQPGDQFYSQRRARKTDAGWLIERSGWVTVLAVQERTAIAEITQACADILIDDYLLPFEPVPVPLIPVQPSATRLTPETGKTRGQIVASLDNVRSLGEGYLVSIDVGERDGVIPGNVFVIYRYLYKNVQRKVLGELAVLTVNEKAATAKITDSYDYIIVGDQVELK